MNSKHRILCGVPPAHCTGSKLVTDQTFTTTKCHSSRSDAARCMRRYLLKSGYVQVGQREFQEPNGGSIRILPKKSKFGGWLRTGKERTRFMPEEGRGLVF